MKLTYQNKSKINKPATVISGAILLMKNSVGLLIFIALFSGCKKFVEVGPPSTLIATASVFNNDNSATAAQLVVYSKMAGDPALINKITGLSSDELYSYTTNQSYKNIYANALIATDYTQINEWTPGYTYIYYENAILENLQNSSGISSKVKQQLTGEAYFMRAYWYFVLTNLYGDVPLILSTDYKINTAISRSTQAQVYEQIIADLKKAQGLLNPNYVDATDTVVTVDRARPTSWAAAALLGRAYLYTGQYNNAELQTSAVIGNSQYSLSPLTGLNSVFKRNSSEAIWQIIPLSTRAYTPEGSDLIILTAPPPTSTGGGNFTISTQLLNAFESGDQRKINWIGTITNPSTGISYNFPYKYKLPNTTTALPAGENSMILRLAEQYLIRAEARALKTSPDLAGAITDLNIIRNRASLPPLSASLTKDNVIAAIAQERRVELFTEGHRWFDLKRTGQVDNVMPIVTQQKGGIWKSYQQLYPIPPESVNNSLNIKQNNGY